MDTLLEWIILILVVTACIAFLVLIVGSAVAHARKAGRPKRHPSNVIYPPDDPPHYEGH